MKDPTEANTEISMLATTIDVGSVFECEYVYNELQIIDEYASLKSLYRINQQNRRTLHYFNAQAWT